jgi:hypothetical protein
MKKTFLLLLLLCGISGSVAGQGFLNKLKKGMETVSDILDGKAPAATASKAGALKMTDKTIFVAVKEYSDIDPVIEAGLIRISNSGNLTYVDLNGKYVFGENAKLRAGGAGFDKSRGRFSGGTAMVARDGNAHSIIFVDQKYLDLPAHYQKVSGFCEGIAMAEKPSGTGKASCYINQFGEEVLPSLSIQYSYYSEYFKVSPLREGLRAFLDPNQKLWGYADENGKVVIQPQFSKALPFSEGLAAVSKTESWNEKWGFVDKQGEMKIPLTYKNFPSSFSEGFAVVKTDNGKFVYIDKTGKIVSPEFYQSNIFYKGYAYINTAYAKTAVIDKNFKIVKELGEKESFEIKGDNVHQILEMPLYEGMLAVKPYNGTGLIYNHKGDILFQGTDYQDSFDNFYEGSLALAKFRIGNTAYTGFINNKGELSMVFVPAGKTLSPPDVPKALTAKIDEPQLPAAGKGTLPPSGGKGGSGASAPVSKEYKLTLVVQPEEAGAATQAGIYMEGLSILLNATGTFPNRYKYTFVNWVDESGKIISTPATFHFTMPSNDITLTAVFKENPKYKLTIANANPDFGTISGGGEYYVKEPFTVKAKANATRKFDGWYKEKSRTSIETTLSRPMPSEDLNLVAKFFEKKPGYEYEPCIFLYSNAAYLGLESIKVMRPYFEGGGHHKTGTKVTISAPAQFNGKTFKYWYKHFNSITIIKLSDKPAFEYTMTDRSVTFYAYYEDKGGNNTVAGQPGTTGKPEEQGKAPDAQGGKTEGQTPGLGQKKPNSEGPLSPKMLAGKKEPQYFTGDFEIWLSGQSIAGIANDAAPTKVPAVAYMEIHPDFNMPTHFTGDVLGILYFDIEPIKVSEDLKKVKKFMSVNETMGDYTPVYFSPLYIYRITDRHIYAMGVGFEWADRPLSSFNHVGRIYRFEYSTTTSNAIVLGKYQVYYHSVVRIDGALQNKYEWINPGLAANINNDYIAEPDKENRYKGCVFFPTNERMPYIPWVAKPDMLDILDASLQHPKAVNVGVDSWFDFIMMLIQDTYEKLYKELLKYDQPDTVTGTPLPTFNT